MSDHGQEAFVTLATNDSYAVGALVLAHSLRRVATTKRLVVMITQGVSQSFREQLSSVFDVVTQVDVLDSHDSANLELLTRPDLGVTFTKLHCWRLTQFTKCVFLDADTLVVQNIDDLFERDEFSAAPDVGWPDCFNSGAFVYRPSNETYAALLHFAVTHGSFDGGDQGLLNLFFSDWATKDITRRLPFVYNVVSQAFYSYLPALKQYGKNAKVLHFIGSVKPWHLKFNSGTGQVDLSGESSHYAEFLQLWWNLFLERVKPNVDLNVVTETEHLSQLSVFTKQQLDDGQRQYNRERGQIDYLGIDSFDNIQKQLDHKLSSSSHQHPDPPKIQISSEKVDTTYPNIDEHFHRSLGSDYSRVVNRVDVPASAAAFPAANVCQGGPVRSPTGTTAAVPAAVPRIDRLSQLDKSYWAFDSGSTDGGLQAKESSVLFESLSESFLKNCKEVMLYLCQQQVAMKDLQRQLNEVKYQLDTDHCCRCTCHQASVGNIQLPSPIDNSSSDEDPGDERQQDVFSVENRLQQTSPVVKAPNTIIDWKKIRGLPKLL